MKFRKHQRGNINGHATRGNTIAFGEFGLVSMEALWVTNRQLEAARIAINRHVKRGGKMWIRVFPDKPFTKKPAETRMGKGKGQPEYYVTVIRPGSVLFELAGVERSVAEEAMKLAGAKLPIKTKFAMREGM
jgi:large subunit ribosomal protein L16